jgi:hypothetical protein
MESPGLMLDIHGDFDALGYAARGSTGLGGLGNPRGFT